MTKIKGMKEATMNIKDVKFEHVRSAYSGRPGCCCGCRGKHYHASHSPVERSYSNVSDKQVRRILNILKRNADKVEDEGPDYFLDTGTRWYVIYKNIGKCNVATDLVLN